MHVRGGVGSVPVYRIILILYLPAGYVRLFNMSISRVRGYLSVCLSNISLCQVFLSERLAGCQRACVDGSVKGLIVRILGK